MSKQELIVGFSYNGMDKETEAELRYYAKQLQGLKNQLAGNVLRIGEAISKAHEKFANPKNGNFLKWLEFEGGFSKSSAYNYMAAFKVFGNIPTVGKIEDSAMYALAQNDTPEKALKEVLRLTEKGEKITQKQAKAIIKKYKPAPGDGGTKTKPKPPKPEPPEAPELSKEEQLKLELKKTRSYIGVLVRAIDDINRVKRNTVIHPKLLKLCGDILEGLDRW